MNKLLCISFKIEAEKESKFLEAIEELNQKCLTLRSEVTLNEDD